MTNSRPFAILGLLLAAGLAIFGHQVRRAVQAGREFDRFLTVKGLSEREVKATLAIWPLRVAVTANDLPSLKSAVEKGRDEVLAYLSDHKIPAQEVTFGLPAITDREEERRTEAQRSTLPRYKAILTLVVRSSKVDIVKEAIQHADSLLEKGITLASNEFSDRTAFLFEGINAVKPDMIREATANARVAAEKFAQDSKAHVGAIRRASQGALEIEERDVASPERKVLRVVTTVEFFLK